MFIIYIEEISTQYCYLNDKFGCLVLVIYCCCWYAGYASCVLCRDTYMISDDYINTHKHSYLLRHPMRLKMTYAPGVAHPTLLLYMFTSGVCSGADCVSDLWCAEVQLVCAKNIINKYEN